MADRTDERGTRVEVARFQDNLSAQLAASRLRASDIEVTLIADFSMSRRNLPARYHPNVNPTPPRELSNTRLAFVESASCQ